MNFGNLGTAQYYSTMAQNNTNAQNLKVQELQNQQQEYQNQQQEYQMGQMKMQAYQQQMSQQAKAEEEWKKAFPSQVSAQNISELGKNNQLLEQMRQRGLATRNQDMIDQAEKEIKFNDDRIKEEQATQQSKQKQEMEDDARKATPEFAATDPQGYAQTLLKYNKNLTPEMLKDPTVRANAEKVVNDQVTTGEQRQTAAFKLSESIEKEKEKKAAAELAEKNRREDAAKAAETKADFAKLLVGLKRSEDHGSDGMTLDELQSAGSQIAAGQPVNQVIPGYGKNAAGMREKARQEAIRQIVTEDPKLTGIEAGKVLSQRNIDYATGKSGKMQIARTLGATEANITAASTEAKKLITITKNIANKMNMSNYPSINAVENAVSKGTGGTDIVELNTSLNGLVNTYARAINPKGVPTVEDKKEARNIINNAMSHGQIKAALGIMEQEMEASLASPEAARKVLGIINDLGSKKSTAVTKTQSGATTSGW